MEDEYSIYCDFDIEQHKKKYVNYLEVLIEKDGRVVYAVPSHQEKAIELARKKLGASIGRYNAELWDEAKPDEGVL